MIRHIAVQAWVRLGGKLPRVFFSSGIGGLGGGAGRRGAGGLRRARPWTPGPVPTLSDVCSSARTGRVAWAGVPECIVCPRSPPDMLSSSLCLSNLSPQTALLLLLLDGRLLRY